MGDINYLSDTGVLSEEAQTVNPNAGISLEICFDCCRLIRGLSVRRNEESVLRKVRAYRLWCNLSVQTLSSYSRPFES